MANFFNSYFYGKSGKKDFTVADLPANRLQLFRDVLSVRRGNMVSLNLLYLLFWIPALFWTFLNLIQLYQLDPAAADFNANLHSIIFSWLLVMFPLVAITGPFNMGVSFVLRTWARDEHSFILSDFAAALKENWKQGLLYGAINGAVPLLVYICGRFYLGMADASIVYYLPLAVVLIAALLWVLSAPNLPVMIVTYRQGFAFQMRNAVLMTLAELPRTILVRLCTLAVPIVLYILLMLVPSALGAATGIAVILYALFMLSFNKLIDASFANYLCEKYLNPRIEGARTDIGLRPKEEE